ncbi:MAG: hypothetical protein HY782_14035 [Chloroflexi bacterium]|nr:hypothetical protein [Chloroflexota bacterium]
MSQSQCNPRRYSYPVLHLIVPFVRVLLGMRSSLSHDAALLLRNVRPGPRVLNATNIPPTTPFVMVMNHYDRPGLGAWWGVSVIVSAVAAQRTQEPRELRMAMAREWWYPSGIGRVLKQPLTHWFFGQLAKSYGLIPLPPVIEKAEFRGQGALAIRHAVALMRGAHPQLVGLSPEGRTGENLTLCEPPAGTGLFLLMLTRDAAPCLPVGIYEDADMALTVNFGAPFQLAVPRGLTREQQDRSAVRQVMTEVGRLLPKRMWGAYKADIGTRHVL